MNKNRIALFFICMGAFTLSFYIGSITTLSTEENKSIMSSITDQIKGVDALGIFFHNCSLALTMFIPLAGTGIALAIANMTGTAYGAIAALVPGLTVKIPALALLFLTPFGIMETIAYSIAMQRSIILVNAIRKHQLRKEFRPTLIYIGIVVSILFAAAFIEYGMITQVKP